MYVQLTNKIYYTTEIIICQAFFTKKIKFFVRVKFVNRNKYKTFGRTSLSARGGKYKFARIIPFVGSHLCVRPPRGGEFVGDSLADVSVRPYKRQADYAWNISERHAGRSLRLDKNIT